ncbi:hypothetical protein [Maribacter sp. ACAM166]|uniref:hypothetical protein n=1 Tax=Maribacter sp. ACAM166 TaxID=2508996 RepID=UPI0010FF5957|nr:hypothetical protein [Maribacter sp. ACAM166]TLP71138.1 hypothetical protein ES765_20095 [Maribacter sp. ACAM166]
MKKVGIWIDSKKAIIVRVAPNGETVDTIHSEIEFFNRTGTGGSRIKSGVTQDVIHEKKYLEKEKHQFKNYFKTIADAILNCDEFMLFGPADTSEKFKKELMEQYKPLFGKLLVVKKADSMTENQIKAFVRDFFRHN